MNIGWPGFVNIIWPVDQKGIFGGWKHNGNCWVILAAQ